MRIKPIILALMGLLGLCSPKPVRAAPDLYIPFFTTSGLAANEGICAVFTRSSVNGKCEAGNPLYFLIDRAPAGGTFTVANDSGVVITDLSLKIYDPLAANNFYILKFKADNSIQSVGTTANIADCAAARTRCINQPDAAWTTPNSNIFDKSTLSNNDRTVDFTDPKTRNGVAGIDKGEKFVDGKVYPTRPAPTLPVLVQSSFSVPAAKAESKGKSVTFNATTGTLTFNNDLITGTFDPADPVVGAEVSPPAFKLAGSSATDVSFVASNPLFVLHNGSVNYLTGNLDVLTYSIPDNEFMGTIVPISIAGVGSDSPFFDSSLPDVTSEFLQGIDEYLDSTSMTFQPSFPLRYTSTPDQNFFALTGGFTMSAESSLTNSLFLEVPEPSSAGLLAIALLASLGCACRGGLRRSA